MFRAAMRVVRRGVGPSAVLALALVGQTWIGTPAWAGQPTEQLKGSIEQAVAVLNDASLARKPVERRAAIRKVAQGAFDFPEMARRSMGQHWAKLAENERQEFSQLFSSLLEAAYAQKIEHYEGEKIQYVGETLGAEGNTAMVKTKLLTKAGTEVPVDYHLMKRGDRWMVYDLYIEGVSLVANYRTQFDRVMRTGTYDDLVKRMRAREGELTRPPRGS